MRKENLFVMLIVGLATLASCVSTPTPIPTRPTDAPTVQPAVIPAKSNWARLINRHSQKCATAPADGSRIVQFTCGEGSEQLWKVSTSGFFQLQARNGSCAGFVPQHADLIQVACSVSPLWTVQAVGPYFGIRFPLEIPHVHPTTAPLDLGMYYLIENGNFCVDVMGWNHDEDGAIIYYDCRPDNNDNQLWAWH